MEVGRCVGRRGRLELGQPPAPALVRKMFHIVSPNPANRRGVQFAGRTKHNDRAMVDAYPKTTN